MHIKARDFGSVWGGGGGGGGAPHKWYQNSMHLLTRGTPTSAFGESNTEGGKGSGDPPLKYICVSRHFIVMRNDNGISPPALTGHTEVIFSSRKHTWMCSGVYFLVKNKSKTRPGCMVTPTYCSPTVTYLLTSFCLSVHQFLIEEHPPEDGNFTLGVLVWPLLLTFCTY